MLIEDKIPVPFNASQGSNRTFLERERKKNIMRHIKHTQIFPSIYFILALQ